MPLARIFLRCLFRRGLLLDEFPKPSYKALTFTPSFAFWARISKRREAMLSLRKLKYSRCILCLACRIAWNISSNFSWPFIRRVTELSWEKLTPFPRSWFTISESLVCALHSEQDSHNVAINKKYLILSITVLSINPCNLCYPCLKNYTMQA